MSKLNALYRSIVTSMLHILFLTVVACNLQIFNGKEMQASPSNGTNKGENLFNSNLIVSNLRGSEGKYTDKIRITWDEKPGATFYTVKRAKLNTTRRPSLDSDIIANAEFKEVGVCFTPGFDDKAVASTDKNTFYAYKVSATSVVMDETTEDSNIVYGAFLTPPADLEVSKGEDEAKIKIKFAQTPGTSQYLIYKSENNNDLNNLNPIATINDFTDLEKAEWEYKINSSEGGKNLYFAVRASSSDKTLSELSEARVGYTIVPGAPTSVKLAENRKGMDTDGIMISFEKSVSSGGTAYYQIYKSFAGGAEQLIIDTLEDGPLQENASGDLYFIDDAISPNVLYTYNIVPYNTEGIGKAFRIPSYMLSPAKSVDLKPVTTGGSFGYQLDVGSPIGFDESEDLVLEITSTLKNGTENPPAIYRKGQALPFYNINPLAETDDEVRSVSVKVKNEVSGNYASAVTTSVTGIPEKPVVETDGKNIVLTNSENKIISVAASQCSGKCTGGKYQNGTKCHEIGTYPIIIGWKKSNGTYQYRLRRSDGREFLESSKLQIQDKFVEVGKKYDYVLTAEDKLGRNAGGVQINGCFAAISAAQFCSEYERHIAKPFQFQDEHPDYAYGASKGSIWGYIRQEGTGSLGSASVSDSFIKSRLDYNAEMSGLAGKVTFTYHPGFGECAHMHMLTSGEKSQYGLNITEPQNVSFTVGLSGDGDYTPTNGQKHYIGSIWGLGIIDANGIETKSKVLAGKYTVTVPYRKTDGTQFNFADRVSPLSYKIAN